MGNKKGRVKVGKAKVIALIIVLIFLVLIICALFRGKSNPLLGKWQNDNGDTVYQFDKDYTGKLIISIGEIKYKYTIEDDKVSVDFESESSEDTVFTFEIKDEKLILKSKNGTFTFNKIN